MQREVPSINWGGCCVFASLVAERLGRHVPTRIRVSGDHDDNLSNVTIPRVRRSVKSNTPRDWGIEGVSFAHVVVEFEHEGKLYHYDTGGVKPAAEVTAYGRFPLIKGSLQVAEAIELSATPVGWNAQFDRGLIPQAERLITETFDQLEAESPPVKPYRVGKKKLDRARPGYRFMQ